MTLADAYRPTSRVRALVYDALLVLGGAASTALLAQLAVRIPFSPVPVTGQTFAVALAGASLGARRGVLAMVLYLAAGSLGLPVFSEGRSGTAVLTGPTGGYLVGFVAAAWVAGATARSGFGRSFASALMVMALSHLAVLAVGVPWLALKVGAGRAVEKGFAPFLPGAALKSALAAAVLSLAWTASGRRGREPGTGKAPSRR